MSADTKTDPSGESEQPPLFTPDEGTEAVYEIELAHRELEAWEPELPQGQLYMRIRQLRKWLTEDR